MTAATVTRDSPYVGLVPFEADDRALFFGRDSDIRLIVANLFASPLTLLYGPTGVGKTSVLQAGVLPALRQAEDVAPILFSSWQGRGEASRKLRSAITDLDPEPMDAEASLVELLEAMLERRPTSVMLMFDQFEEYFLYHPRGHPLDGELAALMREEDLPISVVLSMREDGLAALDRFEHLVPGLFDNYMRFDHLTRKGAREAIEKPLELFRTPEGRQVSIASSLTDGVLKQVAAARHDPLAPDAGHEARYEAPYLQLVMERLWRARDPDAAKLRASALRDLGGVAGILRLQVREALAALSPDERSRAATVFRFLVTPSGSKVAYTPADLADYTNLAQSTIEALLSRLAKDYRWLLRMVAAPDGRPEHARYELVHDLLAEPVAAWRLAYLSTLEERERLVQHGTTFEDLARAHRDRDREETETGTIRPETEAHYQAHLLAFEHRFGELERIHWDTSGHGVALTRATSGRLKLHHDLEPVADDRRSGALLFDVTSLAARAGDQLAPRDADLANRMLFDVVTTMLSARGSVVSDGAVIEIDQVHEFFDNARVRAGSTSYIIGVFVALVAVLVFSGAIAVVFDEELSGFLREAVTGLAGGAFGATISAMNGMTAGRRRPEAGDPFSRSAQRLHGAYRTVLGSALGAAAAVAGSALLELFGIVVEGDPMLLALGILGGFGERYIGDTVATVEVEPK